MSLRLFADQCVPAEIITLLSNAGHRIILLRDVMSRTSPDRAVIKRAQELDSILVSLNGDFADIVDFPPEQFKGIIAVQLHNHPEVIPLVMERLIAYLVEHPDQSFFSGKLFLVEPHRIRIRS